MNMWNKLKNLFKKKEVIKTGNILNQTIPRMTAEEFQVRQRNRTNNIRGSSNSGYSERPVVNTNDDFLTGYIVGSSMSHSTSYDNSSSSSSSSSYDCSSDSSSSSSSSCD